MKYRDMEHRLIANSAVSQDSFYEGSACWIWIGGYGSGGYPQLSMRVPGKRHPINRGAHRVSYETFIGPIPAGLVAMHKCNNVACVSPLHLAVGTQSENMKQCVLDGRHNSRRFIVDYGDWGWERSA
jgi:hypothetical protein